MPARDDLRAAAAGMILMNSHQSRALIQHSHTHQNIVVWLRGRAIYLRVCLLQWCDARARRHDLRPRNHHRHHGCRRHAVRQHPILYLGSVLFDSVLTSDGLSCGWKPCCSSWHAASGRPADPRPPVSAARVPVLRMVRRRRLRSAMAGATARSRSSFSSKLEDLGVREIQRDRVSTGSQARP